MTETTRTANTMQVSLRILRIIEVDHHIDWQDVNTASEQICAHQTPSLTILEVVIDPTQLHTFSG